MISKKITITAISLICLSLLGISGCTSQSPSSSTATAQPTLVSSLKPVAAEPLVSQTADLPSFTETEIASAKKVAETYYKGTTFKIASIVYNITLINRVSSNLIIEYGKENLITFTVNLKDSENPPRGITLARKDANSSWKVVTEGY